MSYTNRAIRRVVALLMSLMLLLGMFPMTTLQAGAATENYPDLFTITVTDSENIPIVGASVTVVSLESSYPANENATTDADGIAVFENIISPLIGEKYSLSYTVKAEGYEDYTGAFEITELTYAENVDVTLEKEVVIEQATVNVTVTGGDATVMINSTQQNNTTVNVGDTVPITVTPAKGYYISEVTINNVKEATPDKGSAYSNSVYVDCNKEIAVTLVEQKTVTVTKSAGGTVTLNGDSSNKVAFDKGTEVDVVVKANDGYNIQSVTIGSMEYPIEAGVTEKTLKLTANEDTQVSVVFVKVYTVTIECDSNGVVEITNPQTAGGSVVVRDNSSITIKATPAKNYRVSKITRDNQTENINGLNDTVVEKTFENITKDTTITITFAPNVYSVVAKTTENGKLAIDGDPNVVHGEDKKVIITPNTGYTLESLIVNGVKVNSVVRENTNTYYLITNITQNTDVEATFGVIDAANRSDYSVDTTANLVPTSESSYVIAQNKSIVYSTEKDGIALYDRSGVLIGGSKTTTSVEVSKSVIVNRVDVYYKAEGEYYPEWHTISATDRIDVDSKGSNVTLSLATKPTLSGYFNKDVVVKASVSEPEPGAGIQSVSYYITFNGKQSAVTNLYTYSGGDLRYSFSDNSSIVVNKDEYNGKDVVVTVETIDRAGNKSVADQVVNINSTQPQASITLVGDVATSGNADHYQSAPSIEFKVTDRADTFDKSAASKGIAITLDGKEYNFNRNALKWNSVGSVHTCSISITQQGIYEIDFDYTNKAEMQINDIEAVKCVYDEKAPQITVEYSTPFFRELFNGLWFNFFNEEIPLKVDITVSDEVSGVEEFTYAYPGIDTVTVAENTTSFSIPPEFEGKLTVNVSDKCGNSSQYYSGETYVVDTIAPNVTVAFDNNDFFNDNIYSAQRTAKVMITEANFDIERIYSEVPGLEERFLQFTVTRVDENGEVEITNPAPHFEFIDGIWQGDIEFIEDGDYTFDVKYTDFSGNVFDGYEADKFTIDKTAPVITVSYENNSAINGNYFKADRYCYINVSEHNINIEDFEIKVMLNGEEDTSYSDDTPTNVWYPSKDGNSYTRELRFNKNGHYQVYLSCKDLANNENAPIVFENSPVAPDEFIIDKRAPGDLTITTSASVIDTIISAITFGFYNQETEVTVSATDNVAGVDYFICSYPVEDKSSDINVGMEEFFIHNGDENFFVDGNNYSAKFTIEPQYRGKLYLQAVDKADNSSSIQESDKTVVVDNKNPVITVKYDNNNCKNDKYYNEPRVATITINEANFFGTAQWDSKDLYDINPVTNKPYLNIEVVKTVEGGSDTERLTPVFTNVGEDNYEATVSFTDDAMYQFSIEYTDRSGNAQEKAYSEEFVVDKTSPELRAGYSPVTKYNDKYYDQNVTATFVIEESNFDASNFTVEIGATDANGDPVKFDLNKYKNALLQNWVKGVGVHTNVVEFEDEGNYFITLTYNDLADDKPYVLTSEFCVDKTNPYEVEDGSITYSTSILDTILNNLTFGFYKEKVNVTLTAYDDVSGINYFKYSYVDEDSSSYNQEKNIVVDKNSEGFEVDGNKATYSFVIPAQFRGYVEFTSVDMANRSTQFTHKDERTTVVDNVDPILGVEYSTDKEYANSRTATITIDEDNFFLNEDYKTCTIDEVEREFLVIEVTHENDNGEIETYYPRPEFVMNDSGKYEALIDFSKDGDFKEDGDYTLRVDYTDRSGNKAVESHECSFTIDTTAPVITVKHDNNAVVNEKYFSANRPATITIEEHNFDENDITLEVMYKPALDDEYEDVTSLYFPEWVKKGNIYTGEVKFENEGFYTFNISYTDDAGNTNVDVNYGDTAAANEFVIDKSRPVQNTMNILLTSHTNVDGKIVEETVSIKDVDNSVTFDSFYKHYVTITLNANFDISGKNSLKYFLSPIYVDPSTIADVKWIVYDEENGINIYPNMKFVVYFKATDNSGNSSIVYSDGIIVDDKRPGGDEPYYEDEAPEIAINPDPSNSNGYHNKDVAVDIEVVDPAFDGSEATLEGYYSGLNKIDYQILAQDTGATESGNLFDVTKLENNKGKISTDEDNLVKSWNGSIRIDAKKFNSNNVVVIVTAVDNAGNKRQTTTTAGDIRIDITKPIINISYSNNAVDSAKYFNANRVATIQVTERNFDSDDIELTLKNNDGETPSISRWTKVEGKNPNHDDDKWTAIINYNTDGDYEFDIDYIDLADNTAVIDYGNSVAPNEFTIDKINPTVQVTYDNNNARNTNYYAADRTATVVIEEHNLEPNGVDANRVSITIRATNDGAAVAAPSVSSWRTVGDTHTATIYYNSDAMYEFDVAITDKAGNTSADFEAQTFYVDKTDPEIRITGVVDKSANNGDVIPVVTFTDTNFNINEANIALAGVVRGSVALEGTYTSVHNGRTFTFYNFPKRNEVDDIYTLTVNVTDMAGNITTESITFSVNRFGSTYIMNEETSALVGSYAQSPVDIVVTETNANQLKNIKLTMFKNNETIVLNEGKDYKLAITGGNGRWYQYVYTILKKNFEDDGVYRITFHSEDAAGNIAENTLDTKDAELNFGIDKTSPNVIATNLASGITYALEKLTVKLSPSDNLLLSSLTVYLDDYGKAHKTWNAEEIANILSTNGEFTFDVSGDSTAAHNVKLVCVDAAGNEQVVEINSFFVTTNILVRYYNNKILFFGSIAGVLLLTALIVFLVVYKKRKNEL